MGLGLFSSSSLDNDDNGIKWFSSSTLDKDVPIYQGQPGGNPNPVRYEIKKTDRIGDFLLVFINYPDCKNYEGNKILVFKGVDKIQDVIFRNEGRIDPHFAGSDFYISPVARFEPTDRGWKMATQFCTSYNEDI